MKKIFITLTAVLLSIAFFSFYTEAKSISTLVAENNGSAIKVSGTTEPGLLAVAIMIYSGDELVYMETCPCNNGQYSHTLNKVFADGTYEVKVADYDGGPFVSQSVTIQCESETPTPEPTEIPIETPTPAPTETPTPAPTKAPTVAPPQKDSNGSFDRTDLENQIAVAASGTTVKVTKEQNISTLSNSVMQMLVKRGDVTLEMEYTYAGKDYHVIIPAGKAVDDKTAWYGPLYLSAYYSYSATSMDVGAESNITTYIVKSGDSLWKIARNHNTTVARLVAANPQIKNVNHIKPGQIINIE